MSKINKTIGTKIAIAISSVILSTTFVDAQESFELGNITTVDGSFIDGHHPSLYINESDIYTTDSDSVVYVDNFKFFARRLGNPVTPIVVRVNADNDFTVLAIGTTRTSADYSLGSNNLPFSENSEVAITIAQGETIATGFMDAYPDGSGWGAGTVIPAINAASEDEIFGLLPTQLIPQRNGFVAGRDTAAVIINENIKDTNTGKDLREYDYLRRSYKFAITFQSTDYLPTHGRHLEPSSESNETLRVWSDTNLQGASRTFSQGVYSAVGSSAHDSFGAVANDDTSSLRVGTNATAWLCSSGGANLPDNTRPLDSCHGFENTSVSDLSSYTKINNGVSTLVVTTGKNQRSTIGVTVWDGSFNSTVIDFKAGGYKLASDASALNNKVSSMRVAPGFEALACSEEPSSNVNSSATCTLFAEGEHDTASLQKYNLNNAISWLSVVRKETNPSRIGQFGDVENWLAEAIHQYLLIDGRVMYSSNIADDGVPSTGEYGIWDPVTNTHVWESTFAPGSNLFCGAYVHLPNGNLFGVAAGGGGATVTTTVEYDVTTGQWTLAPSMIWARYYPTASLTQTGDVLVTGGNDVFGRVYGEGRIAVTIPEIYENGEWRELPGAEIPFSNLRGATNDSSYWPWVQAAPNGEMFMSGPDLTMRWINVEGEGSNTELGNRDNEIRTYGSYATYDIGKQIIGGGGDSLASTYTIDFNSEVPTVTRNADFNIGRRQFNMTVLADGSVFVNGGNSDGHEIQSRVQREVIYNSELWDAETQEWRVGHDAQKDRQYHSSSMLLPDGRVTTAGQWAYTKHKNAEIYSPPYLFNTDGSLAERPTIEEVSSKWNYNQEISIAYGNTRVVSAHLIKLGAVTHATNFEQRLVPLELTQNNGDEITINAPSSGNFAPPGHYMLFLMDEHGVPSVAEIVQIGVGSDTVIFYDADNFAGSSWSISVGEYNFPAIRDSIVGNDRISSIFIPEGLAVEACKHGGFNICQTFTSSMSSLNSYGLDNQISSIRIVKMIDDPLFINNTNEEISYSGNWQLSSNRGIGDYEEDLQYTRSNGDYFEYEFAASGINVYMPVYNAGGDIEVFIDGVSQGVINVHNPVRRSSENAQQKVFEIRNLPLRKHTIKMVKLNGPYMQLDRLELLY